MGDAGRADAGGEELKNAHRGPFVTEAEYLEDAEVKPKGSRAVR